MKGVVGEAFASALRAIHIVNFTATINSKLKTITHNNIINNIIIININE